MERVRLLTYEVSWFRASWNTSKSCIHSTAKLWSMMSVCSTRTGQGGGGAGSEVNRQTGSELTLFMTTMKGSLVL